MAAASFFIGKGGVGKTTISSAYAAFRARERRRGGVLLLSTDPAHSLEDVLQQRLGSSPVAVRGAGRLHAWQVSSDKQFAKFLSEYRQDILATLESGTFFSADELQPLLDTTLPGMAEVAALLALSDLLASREYDEIVVDTAPMGHTLRLFEMPEHLRRIVRLLRAASSRDRVLAEHFGGTATASPAEDFLEEWERLVERVSSMLRDGDSDFVLVTTPEKFSLEEAQRAAKTLKSSGLRFTRVVLNKALLQADGCPRCARRARATQAALGTIGRRFRTEPHIAPDPGGPVLGAEALAQFGAHVFAGGKAVPSAAPPGKAAARLRFAHDAWPLLTQRLAFTVGKGGVGKTTITAALAFVSAREARSGRVTVCSTDPAPSLDDVFAKPVGDQPTPVGGNRRLFALEAEAVRDFERWSRELKHKVAGALGGRRSGVHVDLSVDREIIMALLDVVPPGVDEIFAIFRILDLLETAGRARGSQVVVDMAPTGHALELLSMPARMAQWARLLLRALAPHRSLPLARDVAAEVASIGARVRDLSARLQSTDTALCAVMLAEPLPDRETRRLISGLEALKMQPPVLFVNRFLFRVPDCDRCQRTAAWQRRTLASVRSSYEAEVIFVVPEHPAEVAGPDALERFTRQVYTLM